MDEESLRIEIENSGLIFERLFSELHKVIIGQEDMLRGIAVSLLCKGHILIEGVPGLAKTLAISTFSKVADLSFKRIQFTPDLLPGDITGTLIFNMKQEEFVVEKGPVFANFVLADEINRAPAKVQSALLESMQEKQVTIGKQTYKLPKPFMVMATQNPIEQEGTYPLPEAQTDRFLMKLEITYPSVFEEHQILKLVGVERNIELEVVLEQDVIQKLAAIAENVYIDEKLMKYIVSVVYCTRKPEDYNMKNLKPLLRFGASPRGGLSLLKTSKALALLNGRDYVIADDVKKMAFPCLRHRVITSFEAEADGIETEEIIDKILKSLFVP